MLHDPLNGPLATLLLDLCPLITSRQPPGLGEQTLDPHAPRGASSHCMIAALDLESHHEHGRAVLHLCLGRHRPRHSPTPSRSSLLAPRPSLDTFSSLLSQGLHSLATSTVEH
jgi:hypothetical protein